MTYSLSSAYASLHSETTVIAYSRKPLNMSLTHGEGAGVLDNRRVFCEALGIDYHRLVCARQTHGVTIAKVTASDVGRGAECVDTAFEDTDGLVTDQLNIPLAVFTADCLSVFIYDPLTPCIALVHAGWRGTRSGIATRAVALLKQYYNARTQQMRVFLGPCIRQCCYQVGEECAALCAGGVEEREGALYLDLIRMNRHQLCNAGIADMHIEDSGVCTSCHHDDYFSFRRHGSGCGRMMSVMMLRT
jgi:polyphenol oxidase